MLRSILIYFVYAWFINLMILFMLGKYSYFSLKRLLFLLLCDTLITIKLEILKKSWYLKLIHGASQQNGIQVPTNKHNPIEEWGYANVNMVEVVEKMSMPGIQLQCPCPPLLPPSWSPHLLSTTRQLILLLLLGRHSEPNEKFCRKILRVMDFLESASR